jgi:UDP-GlcNAc:undecaprenyl-phosphate/decaprenyl-phosphate GlcNAc-1-phosphate transferase
VAGYSLVLSVAAVTTFLLAFVVRRVAVRIGAISVPGARSVHERATPTLGGAAMFGGFLVAMAVASQVPQFHEMFDSAVEPIGVMVAAAVMFVVGAVDDLWERRGGVSPPAKVAGMVLSGSVLSLFGVTMLYFRVPFARYDYVVLSADLAPLVTVLTVVIMANAINLIDGLDGLAAGIVAIGAGAFFLYSQKLSDLNLLREPNIGPLMAILAVGLCLGFLPHNFNPARIIMGDSGALLLGLMMAVSTSVVGGRADPSGQGFVGQTYFFLAPFVIPLLILGVPILDLVFAVIRRASRRQAIDVADKGHLHHRLMNLGHGHRRSVLILWAWTLVLSGFVLYPVLTDENPSYLPFGMAAIAIVLYTVLHPSVRRRRRDNGRVPS